MRHLLLAALAAGTLTLSGCDSLRDAFSAQADVVAKAGNRTLSTDRMLALMTSVQSGQITPQGAEYVANLWVDLSLFAAARVDGGLGPDSATVARVMWPDITQQLITAWRDTLAARRPAPTEGQADSTYDAGAVRMFQHVLIMPAGQTARDTANAVAKIGGMLAQIRRGADFAGFTVENNDMTKEDSGFLPPGPRGQFVPEFEEAAWALEPGQVSDVVQSPFGWHLIRRTPKAEALPRFQTWLTTYLAQAADSIYLADLTRAHGLELEADAGATAKEAMSDLAKAGKSSKRLVKMDGGAFTLKDLARWMEAFPPQARFQIEMQPDSVIADMVKSLAENKLALRQIDSAGIHVADADWQALQLAYRATNDQLAAAMALTDSVVSDSTLPRQARLDSAASRVDRFLDLLVAGQAQFRPLPPSLSGYLRESGGRYSVNRAGLTRAMELYTAARVADSAAAAGSQPPAIQPAPGPAPVPGGTAPPTP